MKQLRVGLIGYGFMGRTHSNAFRKVNNFFDLEYQPVLKAVCARDAHKAKAFAAKWGYESVETDWKKLIERDDIDLIDIASPNNTHAEMAIAAAKAGKMILCGGGRAEGESAKHGMVQLPPRPRRYSRQAIDR
jgi:predicted dehydrogenase